MDAKVNDFLNEIEEIGVPIQNKQTTVWKECYDELTGYSYYWNTKTDEVTWTTPTDYKMSQKKKQLTTNKKTSLYVPPKEESLVVNKVPEQSIKIYSIGECSQVKEQKPPPNRPHRRHSDSEDEKIELITSYGDDSESDKEEPTVKKPENINQLTTKLISDEYGSDDDTDIQDDLKQNDSVYSDESNKDEKPEPKSVSGFSLVAGYSDSEEEKDPEPEKIAHSTLFPIIKPINIDDFAPKAEETKTTNPPSDLSSKVFQRKKRIGVALVNTAKKKYDIEQDNERKGFGFKGENNTESVVKSNIYPGFTKGGVMFGTSEILNPMPVDNNQEESNVSRDESSTMYETLKEKLEFLNVGRPEISPVQVMLIQAEMLFTAMRDGGLKLAYLQKWLQQTCSELVKLENQATPEGWLLQWDRSHKRYYYQNEATGESQWDYPQPEVNMCDDAMDISTTPPPIEPAIHMSPPLPPVIRSPTPPPPPIISKPEPLPVDQDIIIAFPQNQPYSTNGEPLPPGVEVSDVTDPKEKPSDPLHSALDSFYSDIAAIDSTTILQPPPPPPSDENPMENTEKTGDTKKKKKMKVKLAPGLTMKKKGVSQLVEKWKNVQQHYND